MKIQITDDYVMTSDPYNFILNEVSIIKTGKDAGNTRLTPVGYYQSVPSLVEGIISKKMGRSATRTMKGFIEEYQALIQEIRNLFRVGITGIGTMPCKECGAKQKVNIRPKKELSLNNPEPLQAS